MARKGGQKSASTQPTGNCQAKPQQVSLFPPRPQHPTGIKLPGKPVDLVTNLFKISLKQNSILHRYHVDVNQATGGDVVSKTTNKADDERSIIRQVRITKELRRHLVEKAFEKCKPKQKNCCYMYVYDGVSLAFTTFVMPDIDKAGQRTIVFEDKIEEVTNKKLELKTYLFSVAFKQTPPVNLDLIVNYCKGQRVQSIELVREQLQALNILLRSKVIKIPSYITINNNVFPSDFEKFPISAGISGQKGYYISARPTQAGLTLNVANTVIPLYNEGSLLDFITQRYNVRPQELSNGLNNFIVTRLTKELKNKQVYSKHINFGSQARPHYIKYRIREFNGSSMDTFNLVNAATSKVEQVTIKKYFFDKYKYKIKYPQLQCVVDIKGAKVPLELCYIVDKQKVNRKLDADETSQMIKSMAVKPEKHFEGIDKGLNNLLKESQSDYKMLGVEIDKKNIECRGRELSGVKMKAGFSKVGLASEKGEYNARFAKFFLPAKINKLKVVFLYAPKFLNEEHKLFMDCFLECARLKGIMIGQVVAPEVVVFDAFKERESMQKLRAAFDNWNSNKIDLVITILPRNPPDYLYARIHYLETTQRMGRQPNESLTRVSCIKNDNFFRKVINEKFDNNRKTFVSNLMLKANTKMGGINYVLENDNKNDFLSDDFLYIGVDVCHPAPNDKLIQSVAASVGMWEPANRLAFCTVLRVQEKVREDQSTIEEVCCLSEMVEEVIESYRRKKNKWPKNIVILRDGVSDGQLSIVLESELGRVKQMIAKIFSAARVVQPRLACFVVQKRHHLRAKLKIPERTRKGDLDYNVQPGTVIDETIVHPVDHDFYIAPHKAIQGTARMPHVSVIYDELNLSQISLQQMILSLCHLSPRCTKATSIPTPINLADLAAARGKELVVSWSEENGRNKKPQDIIKALNDYLKCMAYPGYKETLYYI